MRPGNSHVRVALRALVGLFCFVAGHLVGAQAAELIDQARALANAGDYESAIPVMEAAIEEASATLRGPERLQLAYFYTTLGQWQAALHDVDGALASARSALAIAEEYLPAGDHRLGDLLLDVAWLEYAAGRCEESIAAFERARAAARSRAEVDLAFASVLRSYGDDSAAELLNTIIVEPGSPAQVVAGAHIELAMLELDRFDVAAAFAHLDSAAALLGRNTGSLNLIAARVRALRAAGRYDEAEALLRDAEMGASGLELPTRRLLVNERANLELFRGRFAIAQSHYQELLAAYPGFADNSIPKADVHYQLAVAMGALGELERAEALFALAEEGLRACPRGDRWRLALLLSERARLRLQRGRITEAEADAAKMMAIVSEARSPRPVMHAYALAIQGEASARRGRLAEARDRMRQSLETIRSVRGSNAEDLAPGLVRLAEWSLAMGDAAAARRYANEALSLRQRMGATSLWGEATAWSLVAASADVGSARYAEAARRLVASAERYLDLAHGASELVRQELRGSRDLVDRALQPLITVADSVLVPTDAVTTLIQLPQLAESAALIGGVEAMAADLTPQTQQLLRERSAAIQRRRAFVTELEAIRSAEGDEAGKRREQVTLSIAATDRELEANAEELRRVAPRVAELLVPRTVAPSELRALLREGEALYMQAVTRTGTHGVLVRPDRIVYRSGAPESARDLVRRSMRRLRASLDLQEGPTRPPFDIAAARLLYAASLEPFAADLEGVRELIVVADDAFQNVPWGVFLPSSADSDQGDAPLPFLATRFSITMMPSASAFALLRAEGRRPARAERPFVGFGDPVLGGGAGDEPARSARSQAGQGGSDPIEALLGSLQPLPQTATELRTIAAFLGGRMEDVVLGSAATLSRLYAMDLSVYRVVSFATHGLVARDFRGDLYQPALVLSPEREKPGLLTATAIAEKLHLSAELVLLSACNTGRADDAGGAYGLSALAQAFFAAGAQSLVVSHWAVDSEATVALITKFIELAASDRRPTKSEALGEAMRWMLSGGAGERFRDPAYWAAFVLMGDSRPLGG